MQHTPVGKGEWEVLIRRVAIPNATKLVALLAATYGSPNGSNVRPSVKRMALELNETSERHILEQLSVLRELGLLEVVRKHGPGRATVYQLTFPSDLTSLMMLYDIDGNPWIGPRVPKWRGGRKPKQTGTPDQVTEEPDLNSSSGDSGYHLNSSSGDSADDLNSSSGEEDVKPELQFRSQGAVTGTPDQVTPGTRELEIPQTGTPDPEHLNSSSPHPYRPYRPYLPGSSLTPTSAHENHDAKQIDPPGSPDADTAETERAAYAAARLVVHHTPIAVRDRALTAAAMQLAPSDPADTGTSDRLPKRIDRRQHILLAAQILEEWRTSSLAAGPERPS